MTQDEQQVAGLLRAAVPPLSPVPFDDVARRVRRRRTRVHLAVAAVAVAVGGVIAATTLVLSAGPRVQPAHPSPSLGPTPGVDLAGAVPWLPLPVSSLPEQKTTPGPHPPTDARPCTATDVSASIAEAGNGAGGHYQVLVTFRNTSASSCLLKGYPTYVTATAPGLPSVRGINGSWFPSFGTANMDPGKVTYLSVETDSECASRPAGGPTGPPYHHLIIGFPGGGSVPVDRANGLDLTCGLRLTQFSAPERRPRPVVDPLSNLRSSLTLPATVLAGRDLVYVVTLANPTSEPIDLAARCPSYVETAGTAVKAAFGLNCQSVGVIRAGESVRFQMHLAIPAATRGQCDIVWDLVVSGADEARGVVTVVASSQ